jgi:hypothetical protein
MLMVCPSLALEISTKKLELDVTTQAVQVVCTQRLGSLNKVGPRILIILFSLP